MKITKGKTPRPRRLMLYGVPGVGKSTFASLAPNAVFIDCEDGLNDLDVSKGEPCKSYDDVLAQIQWLGQNDHDFRWVAIDTIDWLEKMIQQVVTNNGEVTMKQAKGGWRAGYQYAGQLFRRVLDGLDWLRDTKKIGSILLCHSSAKSFREPGEEGYDRWEPRLEPEISTQLVEWCDEIFFANTKSLTRKEDAGFGKERNIAIDSEQDRVLYTSSTPIAVASNRLGMPQSVPFNSKTWEVYEQYIKGNKNG